MDWIIKLIDGNTVGGWVRAGVSSGLGLMVAKSTTLAAIFTSEVQTSLAVAASTIVIGLWSHIAKKMSA